MRHHAFEPDLTPVDRGALTTPLLRTSHGFTEAVPHHRSFWTLDTTLRYDHTTNEQWSVPILLTGKVLAKAGDVLFVAGTPVVFSEGDLARAYEGRTGGLLRAVSTENRTLAEYKLEAPRSGTA